MGVSGEAETIVVWEWFSELAEQFLFFNVQNSLLGLKRVVMPSKPCSLLYFQPMTQFNVFWSAYGCMLILSHWSGLLHTFFISPSSSEDVEGLPSKTEGYEIFSFPLSLLYLLIFTLYCRNEMDLIICMFILQVSRNKGFRRNMGSLFRCFYCSVLLKEKDPATKVDRSKPRCY